MRYLKHLENHIEDQHCHFYSKIMGSVRYTGETLEVLPVVIIGGDVDLSVGHVSTKGDVKIGGSVQFGFNVTCGGSVEIAGGVENGVTIRAEGDVQVNKSIIGEKTRIPFILRNQIQAAWQSYNLGP